MMGTQKIHGDCLEPRAGAPHAGGQAEDRRGAAAGFLGRGPGGATAAPAATGGDRSVLLVVRHRDFPRRRRRQELSFRVEDGVCRKEILMEERCQSLDFSGMIYYDVAGRRLDQPPPPRALLHSPLPSSIKLVANAAGGY
uniref:Uncharacterized protein n=1 Tax=Oryza barthii TaxID=65489 RepID=A0A0D3EP02_9ORYZ